jgi:hypothetical protein
MSPDRIVLDVSGRKYKTRMSTLRVSPYFDTLLTRWDDCSDRQMDGSYFIDADPDAFQHVLDFMRRPSRFPLFWTKETGFNYALYNKLEAEADYFGLDDLHDWLRGKRYVDAVKTVVEVTVLSEQQIGNLVNQPRSGADMEVQSYFGSYSDARKSRNTCAYHRDVTKPTTACLDCAEIIRAHGPQYDDPEKKLTLVTKTLVFDETVCTNETVSEKSSTTVCILVQSEAIPVLENRRASLLQSRHSKLT